MSNHKKSDSERVEVGTTDLLCLLADIRAAVGDPTGKLMQDELVARCALMRGALEQSAKFVGQFSSGKPRGKVERLQRQISRALGHNASVEASPRTTP